MHEKTLSASSANRIFTSTLHEYVFPIASYQFGSKGAVQSFKNANKHVCLKYLGNFIDYCIDEISALFQVIFCIPDTRAPINGN